MSRSAALLLCLLGGHVWKAATKTLRDPGAGAQGGCARGGRRGRAGAFVRPRAWRRGGGRLSPRIVSRSLEPGLQPRAALRRGRCRWGPRGAWTGGGAGGTRFAASGGAFGCTPRSFSFCPDAATRLRLLRRPGDWGSLWVAAPRSPLRARVLGAWARRQRWTLLLWGRGGGRCPWDAPCTSGPRGPWLLPATGLPQFRKVLGVSSSRLPEIFPSL